MDKLWTSIVKFRATVSREQGHWGAPRFSVRLRYDTEVDSEAPTLGVGAQLQARSAAASSKQPHGHAPLAPPPSPPPLQPPHLPLHVPPPYLVRLPLGLAARPGRTSGHCELSRAQIARGAWRERRRRSCGRGRGQHRGARRELFLRNPRRRGRSVLVSNLVRGLARHCQGQLPVGCLRPCAV